MIIREDYITDTCAADYKDMDGKILPKHSNIDMSYDWYDLSYCQDKSVLDIFGEEYEYSWDILFDGPYGLTTSNNV